MKRKKLEAAMLACALLVSCIPVGGNAGVKAAEPEYDIYVAVDGSDESGDGSKEKPYATVDKAREAARTLSGDKTIQVKIGEGKYFVEEPIAFGPEDSNVTYTGNGAVLTGAKTLENLKWETWSGNENVMVAEAGKGLEIDQLFIDGAQQTMARYPNYNANQALQGCTSQADIKARSAGWADPEGGYIRALHEHKWGGNSYIITGKDSSALGVSYKWIGDNNRGSKMHTDNIMVENIFEELDTPGEWFYDNENGKLYLWPQEGIDLSGVQVEAAVAEEILHVEGETDGAQVTGLTFDGLTLENTKRTMFTGQYVPLMRTDWCVVRSGALFIEDAENVTFQNGTIRNIGGNGVFLSGHSDNVKIDNNEILNIGSSGVLVAGFPDSCREPSFWEYTAPLDPETDTDYVHKTTIEDTTKGPAKEHYPKNAVISNNHIQNVGIWEKQSSQVALSVAHKIQIVHNTIHEGPRAGVNVGDGTFGGHEIAYNDIFDVQRETDDHGMFNSWGRDRFWSLGGFDTGGNKGAQKEPYSLIDVIDTITIHDNRMHFAGRVDGGSTFGIDLDDGSSNYDIYNNLCLNMGIKLREGFHRNVHNNILVNGAFNLHCTYEDSYDVIEKNIVVMGTPYKLAATNEGRFKVSEDVIDNNWFYDFGMKVNYPAFWEKLGYDDNSVTVDPKFKDTSKNDYTVTNEAIMEEIGFENFPMDQFGKPGCEYQAPIYEKTKPDGNTDIYEREEWLGATISALDDAIMSSTGAGGLDGVYFENVPEDSQAAKFGFKNNDVVKSINGITVGKKSNFVPMYDDIETGTLVNVGLIRNQLQEELNFIKIAALKETIIDDADESIKYTADSGKWEYSSPDHNAANAENCIEKTMKYINLRDAKNVSAEVPFHGSQIELISRKENNMGDYKFTITDPSGKVMQQAVASAYTSGKADRQSIFKSEMFEEGDYTLKLEPVSGSYFIIDAFKVYAKADGKILPIVVEPIGITNNGVRVSELVSDQKLDIQIPITNNGAKDAEVVVLAAFSGNEGALQLETTEKQEKVIAAGATESLTFALNTPEGSESKRLEIFVYDKNSAAVYAYPRTVDGINITAKELNIPEGTGEEIEYSYTSDERLLTVTAGGFSAGYQVLVQAMDEAENYVAIRQLTADENGKIKTAFILPEGFEGTIELKAEDEAAVEKTKTIEIKAGENILDKTALQTAVNNAKLVIDNTETYGSYTKTSWMEFYNAYMNALEKLEDETGNQEGIVQAADLLTEKQNALVLFEKTEEFIPSTENKGTLYNIYRADGTADGGNRDGKGGDQWQVRANQIDATVPGAYAEFKGNFTSFVINGANKYDSADFKVVITDDTNGEVVVEEEITQSLDAGSGTVKIYEKTGLSGTPQTVRVYHNGEEGRYVELRGIKYQAAYSDEEKNPTLESIEVTKVPVISEYQEGSEESISLLGGEITETYSDGSTNVIPMNSGMYKSGFDTSMAGTQTIVVSHRGCESTFSIEITAKPEADADYSKVDAAIAKAEALNPGDYKDFSGVTAAIEAVERGLKVSEQAKVDAMAEAIEDAIAELEPVEEPEPEADADYSKVDAAIAKAEALNPEDYKDFSGVTAAIEAVERGLKVSEQAKVDAMAKAIEDAIAALEKVEDTSKPTAPSEPTKPGDDSKPSTDKGNGAVQTGDTASGFFMWGVLMVGAVLVAVSYRKIRK